MVRGTLLAVLGVFFAVGGAIYIITAGYLMKIIGPNMCFGTVIIFNIITLIFAFIQIARKRFGRKIKFNDGKSDDDSDKTQSDKRGAEEGRGGYDDIPQIYDEQILEADDSEEHSRHGSVIEKPRLYSRNRLGSINSDQRSISVASYKDDVDLLQISMKSNKKAER